MSAPITPTDSAHPVSGFSATLPPTPPATAATQRGFFAWGGILLHVFFGVLLPIVTLAIEIATHMCGEAFFDPIPTWFHVTAIALVPASNALSIYLILHDRPASNAHRVAIRLGAIAIGIAVFYSAWFAILMPLAVIGIIVYGFGLLPLAPSLSLTMAGILQYALRKHLRNSQAQTTFPRFLPWFAVGLLPLLALEVPGILTTSAAADIAQDPASPPRALRLLRLIGEEQQLLSRAYGTGDSFRTHAYAWLSGSEPTQADYQLAYYRLTGRAYNSMPRPWNRRSLMGSRMIDEQSEWVWDDSLGEQRVGRQLRGLFLTESRLDVACDATNALGGLEWTMIFRNDHQRDQREARALIQLPPGAVVSRVTLWVHGEPREAVFAGRSEATAAYRSVAVMQRRDPILVTTKGRDRVFVQCFPIEPGGGEMKFRLGITFPLNAMDNDARNLATSLPKIIDQNFSSEPKLEYAINIGSDQLATTNVSSLRTITSQHASPHILHGRVPASVASSSSIDLNITRPGNVSPVWTRMIQPDSSAPPRIVTRLLMSQPPFIQEGPLAIVIDGSEQMRDTAVSLIRAFSSPSGNSGDTVRSPYQAEEYRRPLILTFANDHNPTFVTSRRSEALAWLRKCGFHGGQDSTEALNQALRLVAEQSDSTPGIGAVLWLHGAQPISWQSRLSLHQTLERIAPAVPIFALPVVTGPNVVLEELSATPRINTLMRTHDLDSDIARALARLTLPRFDFVTESSLTDGNSSAPSRLPDDKQSDIRLSHLWATDEVHRLLTRPQPHYTEAKRLAIAYRIVTPVTGAVVLETDAQYHAAGLEPPDEYTGPNVPEPVTTVILLGAASLFIVVFRHWRKLLPLFRPFRME